MRERGDGCFYGSADGCWGWDLEFKIQNSKFGIAD
jgi:hypothetical protein